MSVRPNLRNCDSMYSAVIASYFVPAIRPQYLLPSSRLRREIATISFTVAFIFRPSIPAYARSESGSGIGV